MPDKYSISPLRRMPNDVTLNIFTFLAASDLDRGVSRTCKALRELSLHPQLWKQLCIQTGKLQPPSAGAAVSDRETKPTAGQDERDGDEKCGRRKSQSECNFMDLYYSIPCVPSDFPTIEMAVDHTREGGTVTLLPGVYRERVVLTQSVRIRAANPTSGVRTSIVWHYDNADNHEGQSTNVNQSAIQIFSNHGNTFVTLEHVSIYHSSLGNDIWNGNCAIYCRGEDSHTRLVNCSIQSDSGRGVVITSGASMEISKTTIHDCAATGLYVGGQTSLVEVHNSNIIRCGFGATQRSNQACTAGDREQLDRNHDGSSTASVSSSSSTTEADPPRHPSIPSGHSGIYIEGAEAEVADTLVAGNCLTGLCLVKNGLAHLSGCDVTENGTGPMVEITEETGSVRRTPNTRRLNGDEHDDEIVDADDGGFYLAPTNNFVSRLPHEEHDDTEQRQDDDERNMTASSAPILLGGTQRCPHVEHTRFSFQHR